MTKTQSEQINAAYIKTNFRLSILAGGGGGGGGDGDGGKGDASEDG